MALFKWFKRKQNKSINEVPKEEVEELLKSHLEKQEINQSSAGERKSYVTQNCQQIIEATRHLEEFSKEYEVVTAYLTDIQIIDAIPAKSRESIDESARMIVTLTRERTKYQNTSEKLSAKQIRLLETYEDTIPDEVRKINQMEAYQQALNGDLAKLEGEKSALLHHREVLLESKRKLQQFGIAAVTLIVILLCVFLYLIYGTDGSYRIPLIITALLAVVCTVALGIDITNIRVGMVNTDRKINKAIGLLNKVKIKYINNKSALDYVYNKFGIESSSQLTYFWEEYMKQKDEDKKYKKNTELLNYYSEKLIKDLRQYRIRDCEVWVHQAVALLDSKELVEIRHRLNVRRQKLRDRMDYNINMRQESIDNIKEILGKRPESKEEIIQVLADHHIEI